MPNDLPAGIEEVAREAIRARGLILRHLTYSKRSLWPNLWNGSVWSVGVFHACVTISWKCGRRVQKFSNLNGAERRGPNWFDSKRGQWSEWEEDKACSEQLSKVMSQFWLQKKRSRRTRVGRRLSLLQVYFLFCKFISFNS